MALGWVLWGGTPLEHPVGGTGESVGATTREEVVRYWKAHYGPSGLRLLVTGDLSVDGLGAVLAPFAGLSGAAYILFTDYYYKAAVLLAVPLIVISLVSLAALYKRQLRHAHSRSGSSG